MIASYNATKPCHLFNFTDLIGDVEKRLMLAYPGVLLVCLAGNAANLVIYRHRFLRPSTTIRMLGYKATANILGMLSLLPIFLKSTPWMSGNVNVNYMYWNGLPYTMFLANTFASFAIWLTVALSVEQYLLIAFPSRSRSWCTMRNTYIVIVIILISSVLLQLMSFLARRIIILPCLLDDNEHVRGEPYWDYFYVYTVTKNLRRLENAYYYLYSTTTIVLPMLVMIWSTVNINYRLFWSSQRFDRSAREQKRCVIRLSMATMLCHLFFELPHFAGISV